MFSKNRDRLLDADVAAKFLEAVLRHPKVEALPVGRSLLGRRHAGRGLGQHEELPRQGRLGRAAGAGAQRRARFPWREAHQRHARLAPPTPRPSSIAKGKGKAAKLCFMGHALMENRHGLVVQADATQGERHGRARGGAGDDRPARLRAHPTQLTLGADKGYDTPDFVADLRQKCVTPHVAQKAKSSAIDGRTTRHAGYAVSQRKRKLRRGGLRLGQDHRRLRQGQGARAGPRVASTSRWQWPPTI